MSRLTNMKQGWEDGKWYIEYDSCRWTPGNMREEHRKRAREISDQTDKIIVAFSGGIDSQACVQAFQEQGIEVKTAFLYLPGHNDIEYKRLDMLSKRYNIDPIIITLDPIAIQNEVEAYADMHNVHTTPALCSIFVDKLPKDYDVVFMSHDPYVHVTEKNIYWYTGYNSIESHYYRALNALDRIGKIHLFATTELLYSILSDDVYRGVLNSWDYTKDNGLVSASSRDIVVPFVDVNTLDRWDYYIKPVIYGRYWERDELLFFPKAAVCDNVAYLLKDIPFKEHAVVIKLNEFLEFLVSGPGKTKRFYENV
jgi:hypothetical protein